MRPIYLEQLSIAELKDRAEKLIELQRMCRICPHECLARRHENETGDCHSTSELKVSTVSAHFGEEPPLVGTHGSGTIFFTNCNLNCKFCQNYDISHLGLGLLISTEQLADAMISLQNKGCHNVNLVTPTHFTPQIVQSLILAVERGFELPLVYNCGGYESIDTLRLLDGIIDIYMPDIKYSDNLLATKYSNAYNYWEIVTAAVKEMHNQVGDLKLSKRGIAQRGLLIRHLILPNDIAGSKKILEFIATEISRNTYINLMDQYYPAFKASEYAELKRRITDEEYRSVISFALRLGLHRGFNE